MEIKGQEPTLTSALLPEQAGSAAEIKGKLQADGEFIQELTSKAEEKEENRKTHTEDSDTAALSDETRYDKRNSGQWVEEEADLAWKELLNWNPSVKMPVSNQIAELTVLYEELLQEIYSNTTGQVLEGQLTALNQLLSDILTEIMNTPMGELDFLFSSFGTKDSIMNIQKNLYHSVTGKFPDKRELEQAFGKSVGGKDPGSMGNLHMPDNETESGRKQGIIYQPAGNRQIKKNSQYVNRLKRETALTVLGKKTGEDSVRASISTIDANRIYSPRDMELAEDFARYMKHNGNLFFSSALSGGSEELYGFLASVMVLKSQTFLAYSGIHKGLSFDLREAVENWTDYHIQNASKGRDSHTFEPKIVYKIYYYMMNLYKKSGNLEEAVNKGLRHAYRKYLKKMEVKRKEDEGSFFMKEKMDAFEDWKEGKKILEEDYKKFYEFLQNQNLGDIVPEVFQLSPWGMFAEPVESSQRIGRESPVFLFGVLGAILLVIVFLVHIAV